MKKILSAALIWAALAVPALSAAAYGPQDGPLGVTEINGLVVKDAAREREIPIKVYLPEGSGPFPVIVYSHGLGGDKDGKVYLGRFWASHGYAGIWMTHYGSDSSVWRAAGSLQKGLDALRRSASQPKTQMDRPQDVTRVLDALDEIMAMDPRLKGKFDPSRIGLCGHSFGAFTTVVSAGGFAQASRAKHGRTFEDPRPLAFLAMSPQGGRPGADNSANWSEIKRPFMTMTGSKDTDQVMPDRTAESRLEPYKGMPEGDKYALWIEDAYHHTFGDPRPAKPLDPRHHDWIKSVSLAFWDAYIKDKPEAKAWLKAKAIEQISEHKATLMQK